MAGPTPRSWITGVESGSAGVFGAAAASLDMGASLPPPPDIPCARAAISSGTGSSAPSSAPGRRSPSAAPPPPRHRIRGRWPRAGRGGRPKRRSRRRAPVPRPAPPGPRARSTGKPRRGWRTATAEGAATAQARARGRPGSRSLLFVDRVLGEQHFEDLVLPLAPRSPDGHRVAHLAPDQSAGDGARDADAALLQIGFRPSHDGVLRALPGLGSLELHRGPEHDPIDGEARDVDDLRAPPPVLQHLDPPFDVRLPFLGGVVLGVLAQVAVISRDGDLLDDARALDGLEALDLALDGVGAGFGHRDVVACHRGCPVRMKRNAAEPLARVRPRQRIIAAPAGSVKRK